MASTFKNAVLANTGTTATTVYTVPASTTSTVIGLSSANVSAGAVTLDVTLIKGGTTVYLAKNVPVPYGSSIVLIGGDQKVVMETGNYIQIKSSAATSIDTVVSVLELT